MSFFVNSILIAQVAGHAFMIGMGPERCYQSGRQPFDSTLTPSHKLVHALTGQDGGQYNLQGVRCAQQQKHNGNATEKLKYWCDDSQAYDPNAYKSATAEQAMCYGAKPNTYTWDQSVAGGGVNGFKDISWGKDKNCDWKANDIIKVAVQVTQQHWGTHFVDMIPQNKKQVDKLPKCEFTKNRIQDFQVCVQPNVIPQATQNSGLEEWQRSTIRLHPAFALHWSEQEASKDPTYNMKFFDADGTTPRQPSSDGTYRMEYQFPMPALGEDFFEKDTPAVFRWVWFCGWDVETNCSGDECKGQVTHEGMGEIFITCADINSVANCKGSECEKPKPRPTTTSGPTTTSNNTTQKPAPGPAPKPDASCKFVGKWADHSIKNKDVGSSVSQDYADWCATATKGDKSAVSNFIKGAYGAYGCCVVGAGPGPAPQPETTTSAPTTSHDSTTGPSTTAGPVPEGNRCVGEPFANTCKGRCQAHCNGKFGAVAKNQCWGYDGHAGSEFILCVCGKDGEKEGPVVLPGCECHREGGCKEPTMLLL